MISAILTPILETRAGKWSCDLRTFGLTICSRRSRGLSTGLTAERRAREAAEAADKAKSELLAMVGHELRTPMEAVIAMAELLLASPLDPTQERYAETLHQSARSLLGVLNDVLDFSKLEAGRFELEHAPFDLHDLVQGVGTVLQARAQREGSRPAASISARTARALSSAMPRGFARCSMSLVDNALKFTSDGSVRLHAERKRGRRASSCFAST